MRRRDHVAIVIPNANASHGHAAIGKLAFDSNDAISQWGSRLAIDRTSWWRPA
jgi:hypothetical protein